MKQEQPEKEKEVSGGASVVRSERQMLRDYRIVMIAENISSDTAEKFMQDMILLTNKNRKPITIILASNGGGVEAGLACIRVIRQAQEEGIKVIGKVHGHAMSMAFLILQVCDERVMGSPCIQMAHGITSFTYGDIRNIDAEKKLLTFWQNFFAILIANRCSANGDAKWKQKEFWLPILADQTPQFYESAECLEMGLVDRVED